VRSTARARRVRAGESALMESLGTLAPDQVRTRACSRLLDGARPWIPDGGRWCKSDIGADGGGERKSPGSVSIAGAEADASRWMGRGDEGERDPIQLVCFDKPQVARRFPHKPERARAGRRCSYWRGWEVIPAPAPRRSVVCRGRPAPLLRRVLANPLGGAERLSCFSPAGGRNKTVAIGYLRPLQALAWAKRAKADTARNAELYICNSRIICSI
jgi:hypothetical protein